jgi:hypothetical protein
MNHDNISFIKSIVRIIGFGVLIVSIPIGVIILILAELLGVAEELV